MPASFSAHLLRQYYAVCAARAPFGQSPPTWNSLEQKQQQQQNLVISGPMSYAPNMHGHAAILQPFLDQSPGSDCTPVSATTSMPAGGNASKFYPDLAEAAAQRFSALQAKLNKKLGPEFISRRPGPGGNGGLKLTYAEGWKIINLANEVFGFNGWSSSVVNINTDFMDCDEVTKRWSVGVSAVVRVALRDGVFHEDVGYGMLENSKSRGAALDKCKKEAVTDGVKRALRAFGNLMGNCLYDKEYTHEVVKMKVPPTKFNKSALHRRAEYQEGGSTVSGSSNVASTSTLKVPPAANGASRSSVPMVIPKAIGLNASNNSPCKPSSAIPGSVHPVATSTPARTVAHQGDPGLNRVASVSVPQEVQPLASTNRTQSSTVEKANPATTATSFSNSGQVYGGIAQQKTNARVHQELERVDTYSFDSDSDLDDAEFLAALEKAEGGAIVNDLKADLGRPIAEDEGIGAAIEFDEEPEIIDLCGDTSSSDEKTLVDKSEVRSSSSQDSTKRTVAGISPRKPMVTYGEVPARGLSSSQQRNLAVTTRSTKQPRNSMAAPAALPVSTSIASDDEIARQISAMRQQRKAAASATKALMTNPGSGSAVDEIASTKLVRNDIPMATSKPYTPSMGGFNFPPGMNQRELGAPPLSSAARQSQTANVLVGMKRTAEGMVKNVVSGGGGGPGVVSYADAQARPGERQPFARLDDLPDGHNAKRVRA